MSRAKGIYYTGFLVFISLLILSILFYKERILFLDPAFQLSYMIRDGGFAIQVNRFVAIVTKIFPFIALKLSLPVTYVVLIYSMSFVIVNFIIFLLILRGLKNAKWALFLLLFNILMISHTFYWPAIELNQGIAVMILLFALIDKNSVLNYKLNLLVLVILVPTVIFSHPLIVIPFVFLSAFMYLFKRENLNIHNFYIVIILALVSFIINKLFFRNWYDDMNMSRLTNFIDYFPNYFDIKSNRDFLKYVLSDYIVSFVLFISISVYYFYKKQILKLIFIWVFTICYIFLVNISFPEGVDHFFAESKYILLSIFIITPLVFDFYDMLRVKYLFGILIVVIIIRLFHIVEVHDLYSARLDMLRNILKKTENFKNKKLILYEDDFPDDTLIMSWASAYEFWLLSAMKPGQQRSILIDENPDRFDSLLNKNDVFLEEWRVYKYDLFPKEYFEFNDTSTYVKYHLDISSFGKR